MLFIEISSWTLHKEPLAEIFINLKKTALGRKVIF